MPWKARSAVSKGKDETPWVGMRDVLEARLGGDEAVTSLSNSLKEFVRKHSEGLASNPHPTIEDTVGRAIATLYLAGAPRELQEMPRIEEAKPCSSMCGLLLGEVYAKTNSHLLYSRVGFVAL